MTNKTEIEVVLDAKNEISRLILIEEDKQDNPTEYFLEVYTIEDFI